MRFPFLAGIPSDGTKIKNSGSCEDLFELAPLLILSDNFADIATNWTEVDPDNKVNVSSNVLTMDGDGSSFATHGVRSKVAITRSDPTVIEIEHLVDTLINPNSWSLAIVNTNAQPNAATTGTCGIGLTNVSNEYIHLFIALPTQAIVANTWYKLKIYINKSKENTFKKLRFTIQGGIYTTETDLIDTEYTASTELANPFYVAMGRRASNSGSLARWRNYKLYQGLATDAPYVDFVSDAGASKLHYGVDFTNLALPAGIASTNLEFAYSYDDGVASYSGKYTLANLKALGAISGNKRYLRIRVYANSNGETQTYIAPINADDAVASIQDAGLTVPLAPSVVSGYATGKYVNLSWAMAATSVTYDIEIDGVVYTGYTSLSAEISMARANAEYSFRVRGVNSVGNGAWSTAITVKTEQVADDETIALAGTAVLSSVEDITGTLHIAQGMTGAKIFDPIIIPDAISQETFEYYVKDVLYNQGRNVL